MRKNFGLVTAILCLVTILFPFLGNTQQKDEVGEWSQPIEFGIVPVAVANLPDGRLLTWSSQFKNTFIAFGDGATFSEIFDPFQGTDGLPLGEFTMNTDHDMFCPGINNLPDGRILSAGGTSSTKTSIYNPQTGLWTVASEMNIPRGYQGNVTLSDGNVFTVGGSWSDGDAPGSNGDKDAEIWSPTTGWIELPNIQSEQLYTATDLGFEQEGVYRVDNHVWLWTAPDETNKVFHVGPGEEMHWIDPYATDGNGNFVGEIVSAGLRADGGVTDTYSIKGNTVMFDTGKILKVGGATQYGVNYTTTTPAKSNSFVIDLNGVTYGNSPTVTYTGEMAYERIYQSSTVLPDGKVLVTGGSTRASLFNDSYAVLEAELFDPEATGNQWSTVGTMTEPRTYHSVAILMADGRVFVGGGGLCDGENRLLGCVDHENAEIYSPPYLFDGDNLAIRPEIVNVDAPSGQYQEGIVDYNTSLDVTTDSGIDEFSLIRFSAATHATNNEQRRIPLSFTDNGGNSYSLAIPGRNLLPPGYYMLFALNANGVPSVAKTLKIGNALPLSNNPNLVMELKFDETSGTTVADSSGNNNNGTIIEREDDGTSRTADDHQFVPGLFGNALELDGLEFQSNSIIDIPSSASIQNLTDKVTISAWVYRDPGSIVQQGPFAGKVGNVAVISHDYPANFFGFHNTLYKWSFETTTGFVDTYSGYAPLAGWNHIVGTYDGQQVRLYANGVEVSRKAISGNLVWRNDGSDYSSLTTTAFYDHRYDINNPPTENPADPTGNLSGITDEIDGKLDELAIYNVALGAEEVANLYAEGLAQGSPDVANCVGNYLDFEYKIGSGPWETNANKRIVANEGDEVFIRAQNPSGQYFITTEIIDGPTFDSTTDLNGDSAYQIDTGIGAAGDGLVDVNDSGYYVLTTVSGCPTAIELQVNGVCAPEDTPITTEYQINGVWQSGLNELTLDEGTRLVISVLENSTNNPEVYPFTITLPNGVVTGGLPGYNSDYVIESLDKVLHEGDYILKSAEGCSQTLRINVTEADCSAVVTEYRINTGNYIPDASAVDIFAGDDLTLSILPNGTPFSIISNSNNGNSKPNSTDDLILTEVTVDDAGLYTFTTASGCSVELQVNVIDDCTSLNLQTEYRINDFGSYTLGATQVSVDEGNAITLSVNPNSVAFSISSTSVNGNSKPLDLQDLTISNLSADDNGIYTFTTEAGCEVELELTVVSVDCNDLGLQTEYEINNSGNFIVGETQVRIDEGDDILLSVLPNNYNGSALAFTIDGPNGNNKVLNPADLVVSNVTGADEGVYTMTSSSGCQVQLLVMVGVNEDPIADISANPTAGTAPLEVSFDASGSTDDILIDSYSWDFGDGTGTSTEVSPTYTFTTPGEYTVMLTITDNEGAQGTTTVTITVDAPNEAPNAVADATPTSGLVPLDVAFSSVGSTDDVAIVSYSWDFGDGSAPSTEQDPSHTYTTSGSFTATLTVEDAEGSQDTDTVLITVETPDNEAPDAVASATPTSGLVPLDVAFSSAGSTDDNAIVSYSWDFGDGSAPSTEENPSHTYTASGSFTATLTVEDAEGLQDTDTVLITVETPDNEAPDAVASATPTSGLVPLDVAFSSAGSTDDNAIVSYSWDFGDGSAPSTEQDPSHTYTTSGSFTATLTVEDAEGLQDTATVVIVVESPDNEAPTAVAIATPTNGLVPLDVAFSSTGSTDDNAIVSYSWDFGDGSAPSNEENPSHTYTTSGSFTATLAVEDAEGLQDTDTVLITVESPDNEAPDAVANATPTSGLVPLDVAFSSAGSTDDNAIVSYSWDFGDGSASSTEENPSHTYTTSGSFTATLTVEDAEGLQDTATIVIVVESPDNEAPTAVASATPTNGLVPLNVAFSSEGSTDDNGIASYFWDFGDGNSSDEQNPSHTYTESGSFTAVLTVTDEEGLLDTDSVTINVETPQNQAPEAVAEATVTTGNAPLEVGFSSKKSADDKGIVSYLWDFGNGDTSTEENPMYTFTEAGTFEVILEIFDEEGLSSTASIEIIVNPENTPNSLENLVAVAPNPVTDGQAQLYVSKPDGRFPTKLGLYDNTGRLIYTFVPEDVSQNQAYQLPVGNLRDGLYFIRVDYDTGDADSVRLLVKN